MGHTGCVGEDLLVLAGSGSLSPLVVNSMTRCVESFVYLICITVTVFAVVNQLAVAQGANTTLPLTYHGQSCNYVVQPTRHSTLGVCDIRTLIARYVL